MISIGFRIQKQRIMICFEHEGIADGPTVTQLQMNAVLGLAVRGRNMQNIAHQTKDLIKNKNEEKYTN